MHAPDLHADAQLAHRGFFVGLDHPNVGPALYDGPVTLFSGTPARLASAGPAVGQHSFEVMTRILGYDEDAVANLAADGVLS
jgi:benzylsuccinate CoA-transferase BbsF subunit